jgi:hypothetical protein
VLKTGTEKLVLKRGNANMAGKFSLAIYHSISAFYSFVIKQYHFG